MTKFLGELGLSELVSKIKSSLTNFYTTSQVYTKSEVDSLVSAIPKFDIKVVSELPTQDISTATVYLLSSGEESQNLYDEFIRVNKGTTQDPDWAWEKLGTQSVDLSDYSTTTQMNSAISSALQSYYTQTETNTLLQAKADAQTLANVLNNTTKIKNTSGGGFAGGDASNCTGYGAAVGASSSAGQGGACGFGAIVTSGGAIGAGAEATTGFAAGLNAKATADGAIQLGTGSNSTANTLKFRGVVLVNANGQIESTNLRFGTISVGSTLPVDGRTINTALLTKQDLISSTSKLSADLVDDTSSTNKFVSETDKSTWNSKQDAMTEISSAEVDALFD